MKYELDPDTRGTSLLVWAVRFMIVAAIVLALSLSGRAFA